MDIGLYYQILGMGVLYEKGSNRGKRWRIGERKRLRDEIWFWQKILEDIAKEQNGMPCHEALFMELANLCRKYKFPHYERVLDKKEELLHCNCVFERDREEEAKLRGFMEQLLQDARKYLEEFNDKEMVYRILVVLHNLPRAMYGKNILNSNAHSISYHIALQYAEGCMDDKMKKEYEEYLG